MSEVHTNRFYLSNYPNPFTHTTEIRYYLPETDEVKLSIYDLTGRKVSTLAEGRQAAGEHVITFDGSGHADGVYFYLLESGEYREIGKMMLR